MRAKNSTISSPATELAYCSVRAGIGALSDKGAKRTGASNSASTLVSDSQHASLLRADQGLQERELNLHEETFQRGLRSPKPIDKVRSLSAIST
ncbi:hypothetical protein PHSY_001494 [Pseudozyma hubeiensis SY62]|uniref:Uncharacterized protein n=1 Tax=Pseudozyma hubeiensis (strain SY62) TaxID=1305764 RepID=R9NYY8_PSEHS|nr:hypothetical protein PHSY_001494 [Pseudozyma hubeiensis SY62]GAC93926.1 hypothetical protein PHSY_001494 [Pseudozyma hubeiensis SY62]